MHPGFMATYEGVDMAEMALALLENEKEHVWLFQDESATTQTTHRMLAIG